MILCGPDKEAATEEKLRKAKAPYNNVTGAWGCLALAGKEKSQVLDRSAAMNLTESKYLAGSVIQSSVHTITTTIYRSKKADLLICDRAYTEALFDAFMDVLCYRLVYQFYLSPQEILKNQKSIFQKFQCTVVCFYQSCAYFYFASTSYK